MANMNFGVNILPKTNNTYSLGNSDYKWNIYANTINGTEVDELTLPPVTSEDNDKILKVSEGEWTVGTAPSSLDLGETSTTAYRGDRGAAAYDAAVTNVDSTPTSGSTHLLTSGGAYTALDDKAPKANPVFTGSISMGRASNTTIGEDSVAVGQSVTASGARSHAEGGGTQATNAYAHAEGSGTIASGTNSHAEGSGTTASGGNTHAEGGGVKATGSNSHAEGGSTTASGANSHAEGGGTTASGDQSHAEGAATTASEAGSHAEGQNTTASGAQSHAEGKATKASGGQSHAEGYGNSSSTKAIGNATYTGTGAHGTYSHAEGYYTWAIGSSSHAEGGSTTASGYSAHAEGGGTTASGDQSHAEGSGTTASSPNSHAEGSGATASNFNAHAEGGGTTASGSGSHAEGGGTRATNSNAHAEGSATLASGYDSHAEGSNTTASGAQSHAEGNTTKASGGQSHAEGYGSSSSTKTIGNTTYTGTGAHGNYSHSEGYTTWAIGVNSHAEGYETTASGAQSHAQGAGTTASGTQSHAEGQGTTASGVNSHAEGVGTTASGQQSHAEGSGTTASGSYSHAEGTVTTASGVNSHAEGHETVASNYQSHAEGKSTTASGSYTHTEGLYTLANHRSQHVFGEYNISDPSAAESTGRGNYVEIVGNGTIENARSNARALDWSGNEYLNGDLYINCNDNSTGGNKVISSVDIMTGASSQSDGSVGLVPAPSSGDQGKALFGDGTWKTVNTNIYGNTIDMSSTNGTKISEAINAIDAKIPFVQEPASGDIATFKDVIGGMPLGLTVGIEPVQDLHGYDRPWVGGAGKNLLPMSVDGIKSVVNTSGMWNANTYTLNGINFDILTDDDGNVIGIKCTGTATDYATFYLTDHMDASIYNGCLANGCPSGGRNSDNTINYALRVGMGNNNWTIDVKDTGNSATINAGDYTTIRVAITIYSGYAIASDGIIFKPMIRLATETDATFEPYSNICPITGWTGAEITRTGKNLLDINHITIAEGQYIEVDESEAGIIKTAAGFNYVKDYIPVVAGETYTFNVSRLATNYGRGTWACYYDKNFNMIIPATRLSANSKNAGDILVSFEIPEGACYVRFNIPWFNSDTLRFARGINVDDTINGQTEVYSITFPTSAGTIYGGTLTVNKDGTGTLVVDRASYTITEMPSMLSEFPSGNVYWDTATILPLDNYSTNYITNQFGTDMARNSDESPYGSYIYASRMRFKVPKSIGGTLAQFNEYLTSNPIHVVYSLTNTTIVQLTAPVIRSLLGTNNVWADTGAIISAQTGIEMAGATATTDGAHGFIPAPSAGDENKVLKGNGTWVALPDTSIFATQTYVNTAISNISIMTGATSSTNGTSGLVPAPTTTDVDKFLAGDGTYKSGGLPMVILSYGSSTWAEFEAAYNNNVIVYCRASSNSNPATGSQTRMAFMAYVNNATTPTEVEFQYYRSMNAHTATAMGDQVFVYKLTKTGGWSVTTRDASIKQIKVDTDDPGTVSWSGNIVTLKSGLPKVSSSDEGKILKVVNGVWTAVSPE